MAIALVLRLDIMVVLLRSLFEFGPVGRDATGGPLRNIVVRLAVKVSRVFVTGSEPTIACGAIVSVAGLLIVNRHLLTHRVTIGVGL